MIIALGLQFLLQRNTVPQRLIRLTSIYSIIGVIAILLFGWWSYPVSAWIAIILFVVYCGHLLKVAPVSTLILIPLFSGFALTQFISGLFIENGGYLSETKEMGSATGGFLHLAVIYILFIGTASAVAETYIEKWKRNGQVANFVAVNVRPSMVLAWLFNIIILAGVAYLTYIGIKNGFPLLTGTDRFAFSQQLADPIYASVMGNRIGAMAYVGCMLALLPNSVFYRLLALSVIIISALLGDKFTEYIIMLGLLSAPSLCRRAWSENGLPLRKILLLGLAITCITMPLVFIVYGGLSNSSTGFDRMKDRMTLQGQLWFLADREVNHIVNFEEEPIIGEGYMMLGFPPTAKTFSNEPIPYQGMSWMMVHFAPPSDSALRLKTGVYYTMGLHAYFLEILGWLGLIVLNFIFAGLIGLIISGFVYSVIYGRLVHLFYFSKFITFWISTVTISNPYLLLNTKNLLFLLSLAIYHYVVQRRKQ